ncbi:MAG TPA: RagB/SusD family nutrient uptake outer membrane protein [Bacteroidales bacterium]|nr:RagB/SusD family nutrient uptake outer membrane protein [Bacteroidales bacterium]
MKKLLFIFTALVFVGFQACSEKDLEPTLEQEKDVETGIKTAEDLQGLLGGAMNRITSEFYYGRDFIIYGEVRSDNCYANGKSGRFITPAVMVMTDADAYPRDTWTQIYRVIASANIVIAKENAGLVGDAAVIADIVGQAYALRAMAHFDLLRLFGQMYVTGGTQPDGIPYVKEYKGDNLIPVRNTSVEVQQAIYADLDKAASLMPANAGGTSSYMTRNGALALKSRVAVYFKDWAVAKTSCEAVMGTNMHSIVSSANFINSWLTKDSPNAIFQLAYSSTDNVGINGLQYIYRGTSYGDIRVLADLDNAIEATDVRQGLIGADPTNPTFLTNLVKFPSTDYSDDIVLIRYEEVVLNYAEALFELNNADANALTELNKITAARGATAYTSVSKDNILLERRREFCFEGFRFYDLARTGRPIPLVDAFNQSHGGPTAGDYKFAFPIPKSELTSNSNMKQNKGY